MKHHANNVKAIFVIVITGLMILFIIASSFIKSSPLTDALTPDSISGRILTVGYRVEYALASSLEPANVAKRLAGVNATETYEGIAATVPVLVYHGITDSPHRGDRDITTREFKQQMFALKAAGYETITLDELYRWKRGEIELPAKSFLLTYDDGRSDSFYGSDPVLRALDYNAVMFAISKWSLRDKGGYYLSRGQLVGMERSKVWEIQAHARNAHEETYPLGPGKEQGRFFANKLWLEDKNRLETEAEFTARVRSEFAGVKSDLEDALEIPEIIAYAFPFSDFGQNQTNFPGASHIAIAQANALYKLIFYQNKPGVYFSQSASDPSEHASTSFFIRRIEPISTWTAETLLAKLENGNSKQLPYFDDLSANKGWITAWNQYSFAPGALELKAQGGSTGAASVLDGTEGWTDYEARVTLESPDGTSVFLWARFKNDGNYAGCNFGKGFVHVEQAVNGIHKVIQGNNSTGPLPSGDFTAAVRVQGRTIECLLNGKVAASSLYLDPSLIQGGFGIKTWDQEPDLAHVIIKKIDVQPVQPLAL